MDKRDDDARREETEPPKEDRTVPEVMLDWQRDRSAKRRRIANQWWDAYESGHPMSEEDR